MGISPFWTDFFNEIYASYFGFRGRYGLINVTLCLLVFFVAFKFAFIPWYTQRDKKQGFFKTFFPKELYTKETGLLDIFLVLFITIPITTPLYSVLVSGVKKYTPELTRLIGSPGLITMPDQGPLFYVVCFFYGFLVFFCRDGFAYLQHRIMHETSLMWKFHKTHHSAKVLVPFTGYRIHLVEDVVDAVTIGFGVVLADLIFFSLFKGLGPQHSLGLRLWGITLFSFIYMPIMTIKHLHLKISFGEIGDRILVSPAYHHIHHSLAPEHRDKNYARIFPIFDIVFGTYVNPSSVGDKPYPIGVENSDDYHSLKTLMIQPFKEIFKK